VRSRSKALVFRTTRELLANTRKHAHATRLSIELVERDRVIHGTVADNGCGFDVRTALDRSRTRYSLGLDATIERLRVLDGTLAFDSSPAGTIATFTVPAHHADRPRPHERERVPEPDQTRLEPVQGVPG
jgi:two-component system NarL family sensor kinase